MEKILTFFGKGKQIDEKDYMFIGNFSYSVKNHIVNPKVNQVLKKEKTPVKSAPSRKICSPDKNRTCI